MRRALPTALALLFVLVPLPGPAAAGPARYVFEKCDSVLPQGGTQGTGFTATAGAPFKQEDNCSEPGGFLKISQTGSYGSPSTASWSVPMNAPPGGTMESITVTAATCNAATPYAYAFALQKNWSSTCLPEVRTYPLDSPSGSSGLVSLGCTAEGMDETDGTTDGDHQSCNASPWIFAHYFAATEADPVAPTITGLGGTLLTEKVADGRQTLSVNAHDEGGGISTLSVQVNGSPATLPRASDCQSVQAHNSSVTGTVATVATPCPPDVSATWMLDTQAYPFRGGLNGVRVCASDFATLGDPNTTCSAPRNIKLDNSCTESTVAGGGALSARFLHTKGAAITVAYGQSATLGGKLSTPAGKPVAGAAICIEQRVLGVRGAAENFAVVKTDPSGDYSYRVPPGPNRELVVRYRHDTSLVTRDVRYFSRTRPSLHASPTRLDNGHRVHFWGRLPGPKAGGNVVVVQANAIGSNRWITFRRATADPKGVFHAVYHFTSTTRPTTYRFRAIVPLQAGYPWVEGHSNPVKVMVTR